jgi:lycopene beta-cyclase
MPPVPRPHDIAIVGGGCAGLQLLHALASEPGGSRMDVLLLDEGLPTPRTWCFWTREPPPFEPLLLKSWDALSLHAPGLDLHRALPPYRYHCLPGEHFFTYFEKTFLPAHSNITRVRTSVDTVRRRRDGFVLRSPQGTWRARQVFSSRMPPESHPARTHLWQHFRGWFVRMSRPVFDDRTVTLMDFSLPGPDLCFAYVLPFTPTDALVEVTAFSPAVYPAARYDALLLRYLQRRFPEVTVSITGHEQGRIPMTDRRFSRRGPSGEILIGTAAGMVKASTGYAFERIHRDSLQLARHAIAGTPPDWPASTGRFHFYDGLLLGILARDPEAGVRVLTRMFERVPLPRVLGFLDEDTALAEELALILRLPFAPFLRQLARGRKA